MNVSAIGPATASASAPPPASPPRPARPASAPTVAALSSPAATATVSGVPATVKPEDRAVYMQILKSLGGNVSAALAALAAMQAKATQS